MINPSLMYAMLSFYQRILSKIQSSSADNVVCDRLYEFPILEIYHQKLRLKMVFTTAEFSEVAIESWPEWYLNPRPLNSVQKL